MINTYYSICLIINSQTLCMHEDSNRIRQLLKQLFKKGNLKKNTIKKQTLLFLSKLINFLCGLFIYQYLIINNS